MYTLPLSDGSSIPCMGFGCWNSYGEEITKAVAAALEAGYRYIDSAEYYGNEAEVGTGLRLYTGGRGELFILSKIWPSSFDDVAAACERSLKALGLEYLDAYLIHWPGTDEYRRLYAYEQLLKLADVGLVKTPGVSNFTSQMLDRLKEEFGAYPAIHEIESHPSYQQRDHIDWCRERGIQVVSYEPINRGRDFVFPAVQELSQKYGRTPAQIILRWHLQRDQIPIPKSANPGRIRENISIFDFELAEADMAAIDGLETGVRAGQDRTKYPEGY